MVVVVKVVDSVFDEIDLRDSVLGYSTPNQHILRKHDFHVEKPLSNLVTFA